MRHCFGLLAIGALCVPAVVAQGDATARLEGRVPPPVATVVVALADSAVVRGLPAAPLVEKALEGAVKGVPAERIVMAVRVVYGQLDAAAGALRSAGVEPVSADAVEAGYFAIAAGLSAGDVAEVARTAARAYPTATALQVAGTLAALGVPSAETVGLVRATIRARRPLAELVSLPGQLQAQLARGLPPAEAAAGLARAAAAHAAPRPRGQGQGQQNPHKP